ncbi:nuclear transport factor 2 family protein [Mucilaginibacter galii]|uniref:SnoaL-like domain-containing protein n=1 Tax=Mucilaginibacter galii TaxID=2005073 RepID=A0A917JCA6_9SPHI|nr:nuclear transport factor 2 family protein [Mucilaginibacter galii]GGI51932.1 hypothetical protein GCM10011425_31440 [Mucilaginibacter galii]
MTSEEELTNNQRIIKHAYAAFNARNIEAILQVMHPKVKWAKAWEGDYANGHEEVSAYWQRQWREINPKVTPIGFHQRENGALEIEVEQLVKDLQGNILFNGKVKHIYMVRDGLLEQMDVELY